MSEHPAPETLEAFALRRLAAETTMEILRHLDECESCRAILRFENEFIDTIRAALRRKGMKPP
jgi:hypothetical protein